MRNTIVVTLGVLLLIALALAIIPTTRDEVHWRWASHRDDSASCGSYVRTWPEGRHAAEAQARSSVLFEATRPTDSNRWLHGDQSRR